MLTGWATDLKTVSMEMIQKRILRTGDGSHSYANASEVLNDEQTDVEQTAERDVEHFWGWNDELLTDEDKVGVTIFNNTTQ